jgi:hypothetical protein
MSDSLALPAIALTAVGLVALALVWPQGQGARSPAPFGHPVAAVPAPVIQALKTRAGNVEALKNPLAALRGPEPPPNPAARRPSNLPH